MLWYRLFSGMLPGKSRIPNLLNDVFADVSGRMLATTVLPLEAKYRRRERMVLDVVKLTRAVVEAVAATLGPSGGVAAGRMSSGGLGVGLPCASAKPSRLFPEVFDDCSNVGCKLSPRDRAIIKEMNESVFALNLLETGGIGCSESCEKVDYSILSTGLASPALHRLHSMISDFRPPSDTESDEAALRRLLTSRAIGGYPLTCDDHEVLNHRMPQKPLTLYHF